MTYIIVGVALLATLFLFIEARLRSVRVPMLPADRTANRRRSLRRGRAELRLLPPRGPQARRGEA